MSEVLNNNNKYLFTINVAFFISLLFGNIIYFTINNHGLFVYRILFFVSVVFFLIYIFKNSKIHRVRICNYIYFLLFFLFYSFISIFWANDISAYFQYNYYLIIFTYSILIIVLFFNSEKKIVLLLNIWSVIFVSQIIFSIFEILFDVRTLNSRYYNSELLFSYPTGFFGNENEYALFIVISIPILLFSYKDLSIKFNKYMKRSIFFLIFLVSIFVLFETHSRTSYISFIVILMIFLFLNYNKFFIMLIITFLLFFAINYENLNYSIDESIIVRISMIYSSINAMIETNLIGVGAGNMQEYIISNNLKIYEITAIHNWFFEILGNYGLLIFLLYIIFTLSI